MPGAVHVTMYPSRVKGLANQTAYTIANRKGRSIADRARVLCPVRTGYLRSTIGWRVGSPFDPVLTIYATAYYAVYVHDGTARMRARPFLRDAMRQESG